MISVDFGVYLKFLLQKNIFKQEAANILPMQKVYT